MESPCTALGGKSYHACSMSTSAGRSQLCTVLVSMMELVSPPTWRGSNSEHAPVHRPHVSVSVSGVDPDANYRDGAAACMGLAGAHDQEEDAAVLLRD